MLGQAAFARVDFEGAGAVGNFGNLVNRDHASLQPFQIFHDQLLFGLRVLGGNLGHAISMKLEVKRGSHHPATPQREVIEIYSRESEAQTISRSKAGVT